MIKSKNGKVKLRGDINHLMTDYEFIVRELHKFIRDNFVDEVAEKFIKYLCPAPLGAEAFKEDLMAFMMDKIDEMKETLYENQESKHENIN